MISRKHTTNLLPYSFFFHFSFESNSILDPNWIENGVIELLLFFFFFFVYFGSCLELQGVIEFCVFVFDYISAYWYNNTVQYWVEFWWTGCFSIWMAYCRLFHHVCWYVYGWDMFFLPYFWWALLLECQACWPQLGTLCFLDHWLVICSLLNVSMISISYEFVGVCADRLHTIMLSFLLRCLLWLSQTIELFFRCYM